MYHLSLLILALCAASYVAGRMHRARQIRRLERLLERHLPTLSLDVKPDPDWQEKVLARINGEE